jgi:UDPglucose 6-dehydrogenase
MRDAPAIDISNSLIAQGARVRVYDPVAMEVAKPMLAEAEFCPDPYAMATGCDALVVITEWNEFKQLDLEKIKGCMRNPVIFDGRNIYDPKDMKKAGFIYRGFGRGYNGSRG